MTSEYVRKILDGDIRAVARGLSRVEDVDKASELLRELYTFTGKAKIVGVTGSPGTGKSTLVDQIARRYVEKDFRVGIIAVDPTSPFSGGAILGDRIRMQSLAGDRRVFIRSMATRGKMGGLSAAVDDALVVLDAAGYHRLIVETVGVGQDEVDVVGTADVTVVVLLPGAGDEIQTFKAGLMEIGDIFVINKADRDEALRTAKEVEALISTGSQGDGWTPAVLKTIATEGEGVDQLVETIERCLEFQKRSGLSKKKEIENSRLRLVDRVRELFFQDACALTQEGEWSELAEKIQSRELDPYAAAEELLTRMKKREGGND